MNVAKTIFAKSTRIMILVAGLALLPVALPFAGVPEAAAEKDKDKDKEAKKQAREAKKQAKKKEREAKKQAREAAKEAKKKEREAKKQAREAAKEAKKREREAKKQAEKEAKEAQRLARENRKKAKELSRKGLRHTEAEEWDRAISAFSEAYRLDPLPEHLYNLAVAYHLKGDERHAYENYQKFLAANPDERDMVEQAKRYAADLKEDIDREDAMIAQIEAMKQQVAKEEQEKARIRKQNAEAMRKAEEELAAKRKEVAQAQADLTRLQEAQSTGTGAGGGKRTIGASLMAVGGIAVGAAVFYGLDAKSANDKLDGLGTDDTFTESRAWLHSRGETAEKRMIIVSVTGAALVAGGVVLYYLGEREAKKPPQLERANLAIVPAVGPSSAGVRVSGSF